MITQLSIQGLAIIETLEIDFAKGFNVITGETGAGKSILIKALGLLTGAKASPDVVRGGWQAATVSGEFVVPRNHPCLQMLTEWGVPWEEGKTIELLLRRQVQAKGRSQAWINDTPVALPSLKAIGQTLLDVFAQHENQKLLTADHIEYVDSFLDDTALRARVKELGRQAQEKVHAIQKLIEANADKQRQSDYLKFRFEELEKFGPAQEDFEKTKSFCDQAEAFRKQRDPIAQALSVLEGADSDSASRILHEAAKKLASQKESLEDIHARILACAKEVDDLSFDLGKRLSTMDFDEESLEQAQERLYGYQDLFRKHAVREIDDLMAVFAQLEAELKGIDNVGEKVDQELSALEKNTQALKQACDKLSTARLQAAATIKEQVEQELADLHMPGSVFQAEFSPVARTLPALLGMDPELQKRWDTIQSKLRALSPEGSEHAEFFLSANPGEPPMPLSKVASGGELSRILLALKRALAADAETCVLVFDEIDSGISGRVADVMGRKMQELADRFQVLCISHLPQVAVYADSHFLVTKKGKGDRTQSSIVPLTKEQSAEEIARLLSGRDVSPTSLANAKNLIAAAKSPNKRKPARLSHV